MQLVISALVPVANVQMVAEKLREAAVLTGCKTAIVEMRSIDSMIEVLVRCREDDDGR